MSDQKIEELEMLMGTQGGAIFLIDPIIRAKGEVKKYNSESALSITKNRYVEMVRWIESSSKTKA